MEEDALEAAVTFYAEALPLLRRFANRSAFRTIAAEAEAVAREISGMPVVSSPLHVLASAVTAWGTCRQL